MNKVKMLKTAHGVNDGEVYPRMYAEGETHEIGDDLLAAFVNMGVVELAGEGIETRETKVVSVAETKPAKKTSKK